MLGSGGWERTMLVNDDCEEGDPIAGSISVAQPHLVQNRLSSTKRSHLPLGDLCPN